MWHIQGGGRSRVSVFSFVKVNGRGNSGRTEEGSGKARWSKEQTQANGSNGTDRASCYEKEEGESLEPKGSHSLDLGVVFSKLTEALIKTVTKTLTKGGGRTLTQNYN